MNLSVNIMQYYRYIICLLAVFCSAQVANAQAVISMPVAQNPVFSVSSDNVFLDFVEPGMTLGANLVITGGSGSYSYEWQKDNVTLGTESTLYISEAGVYNLKIKDTCDCQLSVNFNIKSAGVNDLESALFSVYPNPTSDLLTVKSDGTKKIMQIALIDMSGKVVALYPEIYSYSWQASVCDIADGEYVLNCVYVDKSIDTVKVVVKK